MTKIPIGVQLYSVREDCTKDLPGVLAAIAKMGYEGVEFAGYYNRNAEELRALLDENGLKCCGTHIGIQTLLGDALEPTVEFNKTLGNKYLIVPGLPADYTNSKAAWNSASAWARLSFMFVPARDQFLFSIAQPTNSNGHLFLFSRFVQPKLFAHPGFRKRPVASHRSLIHLQ